MNAFYLINKPLSITSFDVIRKLRKILNTKKMWHTWTLDPLATGALLVAVWNYTKLIPYLEKDKKQYEFTINLDWVSESYDLWTKVIFLEKEKQDLAKKSITIEKIKDILKTKFSWEIKQIPPKYSALKINWKKALNLVREWKNFELKERICTIYDFEIISYNYPNLELRMQVSAWTYIRSIAYDLWQVLWTWWYISKLKRTKIWTLDLSLWQDLEDFDEKNILDIKKIFKEENFITLEDNILEKLNNWLKIQKKLDFEEKKDLFVYNWKQITNIIKYDNKAIKPIKRILF